VATRGLFVTGTGTGVGKTAVSRGLARLALRRGRPLTAVKPLETGVDPDPADAVALERASGRSGVARDPRWYRVPAPVAPWAATLDGHPAPPDLHQLATHAGALAEATQGRLLVEGAGGAFVPISQEEDLLDFIRTVGLPNLVVTGNALGVLSHTLATVSAMTVRGAPPTAVALVDVQPDRGDDPSRRRNAEILRARLPGIPVHPVPHVPEGAPGGGDDALADAVERAGLGSLLP